MVKIPRAFVSKQHVVAWDILVNSVIRYLIFSLNLSTITYI